MADLLGFYRNILKKQVMNRQKKEANLPEDKKTNENDYHVRFDDDITAAVLMLESGCTVNDVEKVLHNSPVRGGSLKVKDPNDKAMVIYVNRVLSRVNEEFMRRSKNAYNFATDIYKKRINNMARKYENYSKENFGLYHDGQAALAMVVKDGFSPEIVEAVLRRNSVVKDVDDSYFNRIRQCLDESLDRYKQIASYNKPNMENEADIYRKFAKDYMDRTGAQILSGADEQNIITNIYTNLIKNIKAEHPDFNSQSELDELMDAQIKPVLSKGIIDASPVYCEAGRDKDQYLFGALANFSSAYEARKNFSKAHYPVTQDMYLDKLSELKAEVKDFETSHSQACMDAIAAKDLLEKRQSPVNIERAICENTEYTLNESSPFDSREAYAKNIVKCAKESLHAENEIINFEPYQELPSGKPFEELGITMKQLYQQIMRSRIDKIPSFQLELSEPFADRDAVEEILNRYPETNILALKETLLDASPRAHLPAMGMEYVDKIVKSAEKRLEIVSTKLHEKDELQKEYNKLRGLSSEGVYENPMSSLKDGRIALKMLRRHISKDDIKKYLIALAKTAAITVPAVVYAGSILDKASVVLAKEQAIRDFVPDPDADQQSCATMYKARMHDLLQEKEQSQPSMDIKVMKELVQEDHFTTQQVQRVIADQSPVAQEPGRSDEDYAEYVKRQAEIEMQQEKEKLKHFIPVPHLEKDEDIDKEYQYEKDRIEKYAPDLSEHDTDYLIAKSLIASGFAAEAIEDELNYVHMPDKLNQDTETINYGKNILTEITEETMDTLTQTAELVRTITTTTTTTETDTVTED